MKLIVLMPCLFLISTSIAARVYPNTPIAGSQSVVVPPIVLQETLNNQLTDAILAGSFANVKKSIVAGADVNYADSDGKTPVWLALLLGNFKGVFELLESGAKSDVVYKGISFAQAFFDVADINDVLHIQILRLLVTNGVDFNNMSRKRDGGTVVDFVAQALDLSARNSNLKVEAIQLAEDVQKFTNARSTYKVYGHPYSMKEELWLTGNCYFYSEPGIVDLCVKSGIDIKKSKVTHIRGNRAQDNKGAGYSSYVFSVERMGMELKPMSALFITILANSGRHMTIFDSLYSSKGLQTLLDMGVDINSVEEPDNKGPQTALDWALANGSSDAIRILMKRGAKTYKQLSGK